MDRDKETKELLAKLSQLKLEQKMCEWVFMNSPEIPEKKMDAILDRKGQIERGIKFCEERLKELGINTDPSK